jgi:hypothetical protein
VVSRRRTNHKHEHSMKDPRTRAAWCMASDSWALSAVGLSHRTCLPALRRTQEKEGNSDATLRNAHSFGHLERSESEFGVREGRQHDRHEVHLHHNIVIFLIAVK